MEQTAILIAAMTLLLCLEAFDLTRQWNNTFYDFAIEASGGDVRHRDDILLVAIDDASINQIGAWPWDRSHHALITKQLAAAGARSITFDMLFLEPSTADDDLVKALSLAQTAYLPLHVASPGPNNAPYIESLPVSPLYEALDASGHVLVRADSDGVVRRIDRYYALGNKSWPHLGLEIAGRSQDTPAGDRKLLIFSGGPSDFPTIPAGAVLAGETPTDLVAGRDIIVGAFAVGLGDRYAVPFGSEFDLLAGAELLANVVLAERYDKWINPLPLWLQLSFHLVALMIVWIAFAKLSARVSLVALAVSLTGLVAMGWAGLVAANIWFAPMSGIIVILLMAPTLGWNRLAHVRSALGDQITSLQQELTHDLYKSPGYSDPLENELRALQSGVEELRTLRSALDDFLQAIPDPTVAIGQNGAILYYNRDAVRSWRSFGLTARPNTIAEVFLALRPSLKEVPDAWDDVTDENISAQLSGMELRSKDGRYFMISATQMSKAGTGATILNFADVTVLMREINSRQSILEFLSHDLLTPVASALEWLNRVKTGTHNAELNKAREATERTLNLAASYVRLVKVEHTALAIEEVDLESVIDEAVDSVWMVAEKKKVRIEQAPIPAQIIRHVDRQALTRALTNLLVNAVAHGSKEGDTVTIECQIRSDGTVLIAVGDEDVQTAHHLQHILSSGEGDEHQSKSFGLGVAYAQNVARKLDGSLSVTIVENQKLIGISIPDIKHP